MRVTPGNKSHKRDSLEGLGYGGMNPVLAASVPKSGQQGIERRTGRGRSFSGQIFRVRIGEVRILSPNLESSGIGGFSCSGSGGVLWEAQRLFSSTPFSESDQWFGSEDCSRLWLRRHY